MAAACWSVATDSARALPSSRRTAGPSSFEQFTTDNRVRQAFGVQARIGFIVTPALVVEGGLRFTRPVYEVRVSGDAEGARRHHHRGDVEPVRVRRIRGLESSSARRLPAGARCRSCSAAPAICASCTSRMRSSKRAGVPRRRRHQVVVRPGATPLRRARRSGHLDSRRRVRFRGRPARGSHCRRFAIYTF